MLQCVYVPIVMRQRGVLFPFLFNIYIDECYIVFEFAQQQLKLMYPDPNFHAI